MSNKTTFLFIRHGQTDWNVAGRWQGFQDVPLNEVGQMQAQRLAQRLASWQIDDFVASDLKRASETAVLVATPHKKEVTFDPMWRERNLGDLQGLTRAEIQEKFPQVWLNSNKGQLEPPNGEPYADLQVRAMNAYQGLLAAHEGKTIAVITHGQLLHVLLAQLMGIEDSGYGRFTMRGNTGLSIVEAREGSAIVTRLNDTAHLETAWLDGS